MVFEEDDFAMMRNRDHCAGHTAGIDLRLQEKTDGRKAASGARA
jgi:hypothetical protein